MRLHLSPKCPGHASDSVLSGNTEGYRTPLPLATHATLPVPRQTYDELPAHLHGLHHGGNRFNPQPLMLH
jgi:hypothetical protein